MNRCTTREFGSLNAWRAIAALLVVAFHSTAPYFINRFPTLNKSLIAAPIGLAQFGVQIFFVISGFCIAQAALNRMRLANGTRVFIADRFRRIYWPYLFASIAALAAAALVAVLAARHMISSSSLLDTGVLQRPPSFYICSLFLLQQACDVKPIIPVFWSLCYEAAFYLIVALCMWLAMRARRANLMLDLCDAATVVCSLMLLLLPSRVPYPLDRWPQFGVGIMVFELLIVSDRGRARLSLAVSAAVLLLAQMSPATLGSFPNFAYETTITLVFVGILLTTYRFDEAIARWPLTRALGAIGIFSYSIYLTHWLSLGIISQCAKHVPLNEHTFWFVDAAQIIFAVVAAWFFFRVCELPFMRRRPRPAVAGSARKASAPIGVATSSLAPTPEPSSGAISSSGRAQWMSGRFEG